MKKMRSGDLLDLFEYFENTNFLNNYKGNERDKKRKMLQSSVSDLYIRMFSPRHDLTANIDTFPTNEDTERLSPLFSENLSEYEIFMQNKKFEKPIAENSEFDMELEFKAFEVTRSMRNTLKLIYNALKAIKPTNIEPERVFSMTTLYLTM
ncbi:hypothetical protein DMUE_4637 [Dictyocoela muelleri]|nr:hypothetical protein DMUE_4637 [Dictyocoela muelleri]